MRGPWKNTVVLLPEIPPAPTTIEEALEQFRDRWVRRFVDDGGWRRFKAEVAKIAWRFEEPHYFVKRKESDPYVPLVWTGEMSEVAFEAFLDRKPKQDDLHRVNCLKAGQMGHFMCGWCQEHERPRFQCGCLKRDGV